MTGETTFCKTCHSFDSYVCNGDNQICTSCGDTENIIFESDDNYDETIREYGYED